jgi:hypothetical protein
LVTAIGAGLTSGVGTIGRGRGNSERKETNRPTATVTAEAVEEEYGVQLKGEDMKTIKTVGDAIDLAVSRA